MEIRRIDEQTLALSGLDLLFCELLHQISVSAEVDDDSAVYDRIYSSPTGSADADYDEEWSEYVEPELRELFESAMQTVQNDLKDFPPDDPKERYTLHIPMKHLDAWLNALNQARLALASRHNFTEREMENAPRDGDARALALFQVHFYGFLQECFLREMEQ